MPKPPFRPKVAGIIGFAFGIVAGALVSAINLRRMGHTQKAKKVMWISLLAAVVVAAIILLIPDALERPVGLAIEAAWYFIFPKVQDREFSQWLATHNDISPSNGWKAMGWGFLGIVMLFAIAVALSILLGAIGIFPTRR